jgi:hypothetical protein
MKKQELKKFFARLPAGASRHGFTQASTFGAGFTVMELIVSFTILSLSLAGFTGMMVSSIRDYRNAEERYTAAKIAQEGMELAQNKKDNNVQCIAANVDCPLSDWQDDLVGDFQVDATRTGDLVPGGRFAAYNSTNYVCIVTSPASQAGKFGYCGASGYLAPKYTREVKITALNDHEVSVVTTVKWDSSKSIVLQSLLFSDQ